MVLHSGVLRLQEGVFGAVLVNKTMEILPNPENTPLKCLGFRVSGLGFRVTLEAPNPEPETEDLNP